MRVSIDISNDSASRNRGLTVPSSHSMPGFLCNSMRSRSANLLSARSTGRETIVRKPIYFEAHAISISIGRPPCEA